MRSGGVSGALGFFQSPGNPGKKKRRGRKVRVCLCCGRDFMSHHKFHRVCYRCHDENCRIRDIDAEAAEIGGIRRRNG